MILKNTCYAYLLYYSPYCIAVCVHVIFRFMIRQYDSIWYNDLSFRSDSIHIARPVLEAGYHYAAIGYLDNKSEEQPTLYHITERIVKAVNTLCDFSSQHQIR